MKRNCCDTCGNCRENGHLWIEGYHGKKSLNFTGDSDIIKNVAAFQDHGFNISECCVPVIKVTPKNLMDQLLYPVETSQDQLTADLGVKDDASDDTVLITGSLNFSPSDIQTAFENFFLNLDVCDGSVQIKYTVTVDGASNSDGPFVVTAKLSFQKNNVELTAYTLTSNSFTIGTDTIITFTPTYVGTTLILGDTVFTFAQFAIFALENFINGGEGGDQVTLRLKNHMLATCKQHTLSSFITCVDESCVS